MKLGLIVEGLADGSVCKVAAERLVQGVVVHEPTTLLNKPKLLQECGQAAQLLLTSGKCDKVIILWDLYPNWTSKGDKPCRKSDRETALSSLKAAGLEGDARVSLVCIKKEMEAWLISDAAAITAVLRRYNSADRIERVKLPGKAESHGNPRGWIDGQLWKNAGGRKYLDREHGPAIFSHIADLKVLRKVTSFARFATKLLGSSWPPPPAPPR